ncbi:MAG: hypothetical protein AAGA55_03970 [Planctomycetota bacterium]
MPKALKIILGVLLGIPLLCCVLPYGCLYVLAPTTYEYRNEHDPERTLYRDRSVQGVHILVRPYGESFYAGTHSGPAYLQFSVRLDPGNEHLDLQILGIEVHSSASGEIPVFESDEFPMSLEFTEDYEGRMAASIPRDRLFDTSPELGENFTFVIRFEVHDQGGTTEYIRAYDFAPLPIRDPLWFMPTA